MMARAAQTPGLSAGVLAVRDLDAAALSRHRPHQGAAARRQRARRVHGAADLYRLVLRQRLQPVRPHLPGDRAGRARTIASIRRTCSRSGCATRAARPCRSARSPRCATSPGPIGCRATTSIRPPSSMARRRPAIRQGQAIDDHGEARRRNAAGRLQLRMDDARVSSRSGPATPRSSPSCWRWCSCSWCWRRSTRA